VRTLVSGPVEAGRHAIVWRGRDDRGRAVASGVYFVRFETDGFVGDRKVLRISRR
jgi:hypothetical protein